jgi:hypothetical protein
LARFNLSVALTLCAPANQPLKQSDIGGCSASVTPRMTKIERRAGRFPALRAELPHFVDFLTKWQIPTNLISHRYGITHHHHPEILDALGTLAPETRLLEIIDTELFDSPAAGGWEGSASQLERLLTRATNAYASVRGGCIANLPSGPQRSEIA